MAVENLTQWLVNEAICGNGKDKARLYDTRCKGLMLEVRATGTKTYFIKYTDQRGRRKQMKLGRACDISVSQARQQGHKVLGDVAMGRDPLEEKRMLQSTPTLENFAWKQYMPYVKGYKRS